MSITEIQRRINELSADIVRQKEVLKQLETKKGAAQRQLNAILDPVACLPLEISPEIFIQCLPGPLLFLNICNTWTHIALSTPALWAVIHPEDTIVDLKNLLNTWLKRAGSHHIAPKHFMCGIPGVVYAYTTSFFNYFSSSCTNTSTLEMFIQSREQVKLYTLEEQRALASKTIRKVRAFLHGAYRFEARYADYPKERDVIESGGAVLSGAQLNEGTKYYVLWDYQGEAGKDCWKFRGGSGFPGAILDMEDSMADDPNIGMRGNLLQMAASDWAQSFYDMAANYEAYGSVVRPQEPGSERYYDPSYHAIVSEKWNPIFERVKADEHDVVCMFVRTRPGCLAPAGACPFKHS
ncbi:hypothetical protein DFH09DRAFT_1368266 [Mycena vulgaris]|nr:hypothetical protein DFH09DRAFT_1372008 [Mycena vulgaris]KAJ6542072.1 hypothetical protein DFH09DRAFT_1368266 [Mycena vulgaris]